MKKVIGPFKLYEKKPNDITHGYLYECLFDTPLPKENKRMVRVFVPEDYFTNKNKRYGVCYMSDGQNLVDKYLSAYGEWDIDEHNFALMNEGYDGLIYVGIDCPKDSKARSAELTPSICDIKKSRLKGMQNYTQCGELYLDFIFDTLKPIIDENFKTKKDRKHTFFGGSSMGGLIAFFAAFYKSEMLSGVLSFSPALFLMKVKSLKKFLSEVITMKKMNTHIALLVGGKDFEHLFIHSTYIAYNYLLKHGYKDSEVSLVMDTKRKHHESFWSDYFEDGMRFLLDSSK